MDWLVTELVVGQVTRLAGEQGSLLWWSEGGGGLEDGFAGSVLLCCGGVGGEEEGAAGGASFLVVILQGVSGGSLRGDAFGSGFSDEGVSPLHVDGSGWLRGVTGQGLVLLRGGFSGGTAGMSLSSVVRRLLVGVVLRGNFLSFCP